MIISIPIEQLPELVSNQLENFFPISKENKQLIANQIFDNVLNRLEKNFAQNPNKYYSRNGETYFNPFHSGQYCIFLYFLSNDIWKAGDSILADKIYYLNKIMNGCDMFYEVELPEYFSLDHPIGSVIGRGSFSNGFFFSQNCTVGNNKGIYPVLGENLKMCGNSTVIGNCNIGENVTLGFGTVVKDQDIPNNCNVFGHSPNLIIKHKK